ncbi:hypothetical protein RUMCAL_02851 [Ruminococcus callidus ATCC 27760]|uniref:Uncharacterized protein n=1 Tax=Ruminococcus callidus ATCC 27760 TaxID=411473 RepID=U2KDG7_9FIRM|nr:hypothetical protein RUMCAL_02851 [Ruminococcus callidus ATCC 27760]
MSLDSVGIWDHDQRTQAGFCRAVCRQNASRGGRITCILDRMFCYILIFYPTGGDSHGIYI